MTLSAKPVLTHFPGGLDRINHIDQIVKMLRLFTRTEHPWKAPTASRDSYDAADDSEQRDHYGPVWAFARPAQKLKLVCHDVIRTLAPCVRYLGYTIVKAAPLGFESLQNNQTSLAVLKKD